MFGNLTTTQTKNRAHFAQSGPFEVFLGVFDSQAMGTTSCFEILKKYVFLDFLGLRKYFCFFFITIFFTKTNTGNDSDSLEHKISEYSFGKVSEQCKHISDRNILEILVV